MKRRYHQQNPKPSARESGIAILLVAILLVAIVAVVAFGIDTFLAASAKAQHHFTTEQAVLAAMEAYVAEKGSPYDPEFNRDRLALAAERAAQIASLNVDVWLARGMVDDPDSLPSQQIGTLQEEAHGILIPGRWHFVDPGCGGPNAPPHNPDSPDCPCGGLTGTLWQEPCFERVRTDQPASALRLDLRLSEESPLRTMFARVIGTEFISISSSATATQIPRRGIFALDLSPSITTDSHPSNENHRHIFELDSGFSCSDIALLSCLDRADKLIGFVQQRWRNMCGQGTEWLMYGCQDGLDSLDDGLAVPSVLFHQGRKPEPLSSILEGIHSAMNQYEQRAVAGDLMGIIGFDVFIAKSRSTASRTTADPDPILVDTESTEFARYKAATTPIPSDAGYNLEEIRIRFDQDVDGLIDVWFFPRQSGGTVGWSAVLSDGGTDSGSWPVSAFTDLTLALQQSLGLLNEAPESRISENFVVLFTDGLANCVQDENAAYSFTWEGDTYTVNSRCFNYDAWFHPAFQETLNVLSQYSDHDVSLHTFLVGDQVRPHNLVIKGQDGCMTEYEARVFKSEDFPYFSFVDPGSGESITHSLFHYPNNLWHAARSTNGYWLPLRNPCQTRLAEPLDDICNERDVAIGTVITDINESDGAEEVDGVDAQSRLLCDPYQRTKAQQVQDAINAIMGRNPFLLVE